MSLKTNLRRLRLKVNPSAKAFADQIGINYTKYLSYENGVWPNEKTLVAIADGLHVSVDSLLGHSVKKYDEYKEIVEDITTDDGTVYRVTEEAPSGGSSSVVVHICDKDSGEERSRISFSSKNEFIFFMRRLVQVNERSSRIVLNQLIIDLLQIKQEEKEV